MKIMHMTSMFKHQKKNIYFRLNFSRKKHFATKNPFSRLRQIACDKLITNDKRYCMKEKVNNYISSFDYIIYVLSHVTKMQLFLSQFKSNDVLPRVLIFYYY
jgi:hypothetical protein